MKIRNMSNAMYGMMFAAYVGSGPIYWFPLVDVHILNIVKYSLFFAIIILPVFRGYIPFRFSFPGGKLIVILFAAFFFLSLPAIGFGEFDASLYKFQNTVQIFLFLFACGFAIKENIMQFIVHHSVRIFVMFSVISCALILVSPEYINNLNGLDISTTGLGGTRTGWSPAVSLYLPWLYAEYAVISGYLVWVAVLSMVANQVLVSGRTGMVSALVAFLFYGVFRKNIKVFLVVAIATVIMGVLAMNNREALRIEIDTDEISNTTDWNEISSHRTDDYAGALEQVFNHPFFGMGTGVGQFEGVHNVVLRCAVEGGIPYALSLVGLLVAALYRGWQGWKNKDWFVVSAFLTVLSGTVSSMFEPVGMLGNFNSAPFWWLCFAICVNAGQSKIKTHKKFTSIQVQKVLVNK